MGLNVWHIVGAALRSIGTALSMAVFGGLLARGNGPLTPTVLKGLAKISMLVTIPCLLFTNILNCTQDWSSVPCTKVGDTIGSAWPMLFLPLLNVLIGAFFGWIIVTITKPPKNFRRAAITACAFGNSTGLPITLLTVIHSSFSPTTNLGHYNPVLFLSVYLLLYPMLQWGVGGALLGEENEASINTNGSLQQSLIVEEEPANLTINARNRNLSINRSRNPSIARSRNPSVARSRNPSIRNPSVISSHSNQEHYTYLGKENPESNSKSLCSCLPTRLRDILPMILKPAVITVCVAVLFAVTPIRGLFVDLEDRDDDAPFEWFFDGAYRVGRAAVPLNMFLLGAKLSRGAKWNEVSLVLNLLIAFVKLIIMPCVGVATVFFLKSFLPLDPTIAPTFYLVVMIVTCTPTANSIMVMAEVSGQNKKALATCIFTQYMFAPFTLSGSVTIFVSLVEQMAQQNKPIGNQTVF